MPKNRIAISADLAAEVLFNSDRTCCVCTERGKTIQIHHIDGDPSHNVAGNLAVLCLECHNDTQVEGGFGRRLNDVLVKKYRDEWLARVVARRREAAKRALGQNSEGGKVTKDIKTIPYSQERDRAILAYINSLPAFRAELRSKAQPEWDSGVTARMVNASYEYVDAIQGVLVTLASFYPEGTFGGGDPHEFFSELISSRYAWHRAIAEPHGPGTGGTIVNVLTSGGVLSDVEKMVEDVAQSLVGFDDDFDWQNWPKAWNS